MLFMEKEFLRSLVRRYNSEKNLENWKILESYIEDKHSCKVCDGPIFYENSLIRLSREGFLRYDPVMTSCKTHKKIDENIYYLKVCQKCILEKFPEYSRMNKSRVFNHMCEITKYAFDIPDQDSKRFTKKLSVTLENLIKRHGEILGKEKWERYRNLQSVTNTFEYKKEKYGWTEKDFKEFNISRGVTLKNLIKKHGEQEGTKIFNNYVEKQKVNGKTLEYFIEKLGEKNGKIRYKEISLKKAKGGFNSGNSYSKVSQEFFKTIDKTFSTNFKTFYASKNTEWIIYLEGIKKCLMLDYFIKDLKVCIEFNGDYYHANPKKYHKDFEFPEFSKDPSFITKASDIWKKDDVKKDILFKEYGIKTVVVWESDYYKNKNNEEFYKKIIKQCIEK